MFQPLEVIQNIFTAPVAEELAMLGDVIEILYGNITLVGVVVEGNPMLDEDKNTWFKVEGIKLAYDGQPLLVASWVTDNEVVRIISKA